MSSVSERTPIVIGVGEVTNRSESLEDAREPVALIAEAVQGAEWDAGAKADFLKSVDSLDVVGFVSWPYDDAAARVAQGTGMVPARCELSEWGGNVPMRLVDEAATRLVSGQSEIAVICGGEALKTVERYQRQGKTPPWPEPPPDAEGLDFRRYVSQTAWDYGLYMPIRSYPLWENASRAAMGMSFADSQAWSARIWSRLSEVAARNPCAWNPKPMAPEQIMTPRPENRMICHPYPKFMNAIMSVDQAGAVILTTPGKARSLGVPEDKWIYLWSGAGMRESQDFLQRPHYQWSPGMKGALDGALSGASLEAGDVDLFELYSCFPVAPKLALSHLRLPDECVSVTGGLTFFGGPGNNYTTHGLAAMVRALREGQGSTGLIYGQSGFMIKHHALVVGREPPRQGYIAWDARERQRQIDTMPKPELVDGAKGACRVETYTVVYDRSGEPETGIVVGLLDADRRFVAHTAADDPETIQALLDPDMEPVGREGVVETGKDGRHYFRIA